MKTGPAPAESLQIRRVPRIPPHHLTGADFSFDVTEEARAPFDGDGLSIIVPVTPYTKRYPFANGGVTAAGTAGSMLAAGYRQDRLLGYTRTSRAWNGCGQIDDLAVDRASRRRGIGRRLLDEAVAWAAESGLALLRLETQSNNVPACRLYQHYGFRLGGFDRCLYAALGAPQDRETALFWYLPIRRP